MAVQMLAFDYQLNRHCAKTTSDTAPAKACLITS